MTQTSSSPGRPSFQGSAIAPDKSMGVLVADGVIVAIGIVTIAILSLFFDARTAAAVATLPPNLVEFARYTSALGLSGYMFAIAFAILFGCTAALRIERLRPQAALLVVLRERALYIIAVLAISGIAAQVFKHMIGRARPTLMATLGPYHFDLLSMKASLASFPSGHTTTVFAMAAALGYFAPRGRIPLFAIATLIGISRVIVEAHYVSDVVVGAILGSVTAMLTTWLFASWSLAFERDVRAPRLKSDGVIAAELRRMQAAA